MSDTTTANSEPGQPSGLALTDQLGPLPPHRKVTAHGRMWIEEDLLAYGRQERAAERDCRTCAHYLPHHRAGVLHCTEATGCVDGGRHRKAWRVQLWRPDQA